MFEGAFAKEVMMHADFAISAFAVAAGVSPAISLLASHAVALCVSGSLLVCHFLV
jgi:hypothetical protein